MIYFYVIGAVLVITNLAAFFVVGMQKRKLDEVRELNEELRNDSEEIIDKNEFLGKELCKKEAAENFQIERFKAILNAIEILRENIEPIDFIAKNKVLFISEKGLCKKGKTSQEYRILIQNIESLSLKIKKECEK